jgi:hypothetical protein
VSESANDTNTEAEAAAKPAGPRCRSCGTPLAQGQEWCLECGSARTPNRWRSGRRPLLLTSGLTIGLLGVAVAASYAAIVDDPSAPGSSTVPAPPPVVAVAPPVDTTPTVPSIEDTNADATTDPIDPIDSSTSDPSFPATDDSTSGSTDTGSTGGSTDSGSSGTSTGTTTTTTTTNTTTTPTPPAPVAISLKGKDASLYDPLQHQLAPDGGDPAAAIGDASSAWIAQTDPANPKMQIGLLITLPKKSTVSELTFSTSTPGFNVQVYGSFEADLPTEINDSRWAFLRSRNDVDGPSTKDDNKADDGDEHISLADDGEEYKMILLWLTKPPTSGPPAKLSAVKLYK